MSNLLKPGQILTSESSRLPCIVEGFLGAGGQGEVYQATWAGKTVALKWYFRHQATHEQRAALNTLVELGSPNNRFLWPHELAVKSRSRSFGYVMPLREPRYKSIVDLMQRTAEPGFRALITACIELSDAFLRLHSRGLCYRDISFGNVLFDPETGEVLICDNDNVAVDGISHSHVLGTPRFMAPEVVRGEAYPSILTDIYSLAVLLFYLLMLHHPLDGEREAAIKCLDLPAMNRLYGERPLFIFDPADSSNAPLPGIHDNALEFWPLYPRSIQRLFTRAFTAGLSDATQRVRESEWRAALTRVRDQILICQCGQESLYCAERHRETGRVGCCWFCGEELRLPIRMRLDGQLIHLFPNTRLFAHHTELDRGYDFETEIASVIQNRTGPDQWGLRNLSARSWRVTLPDRSTQTIDPQRTIALLHGTWIDFGTRCGEIVEAQWG
jgi:DNA-binding helix-hairpin-helix protein with protein kinase domain